MRLQGRTSGAKSSVALADVLGEVMTVEAVPDVTPMLKHTLFVNIAAISLVSVGGLTLGLNLGI